MDALVARRRADGEGGAVVVVGAEERSAEEQLQVDDVVHRAPEGPAAVFVLEMFVHFRFQSLDFEQITIYEKDPKCTPNPTIASHQCMYKYYAYNV